MKPDRWQKIDLLFQSALACAPEEREAFLIEKCGDDERLRREVESLIASHKKGDLLETPLSQIAAEVLLERPPRLVPGQTIGNYKILSLLGEGGMGEVYLAQDLKLGRQIALKLLPPQFTNDADRLHRFEQEAYAASALNHPNIVTIHEIGQVDGDHFIVTEFIDGQTLREKMAESTIQLREALDMAIQLTSALAAAHLVGIVHRDIKPENIMLRRDGYIKVLDFGLAKLTEPQGSNTDTQAPTKPMVNTSAGTVLGTTYYMSPEQAKGTNVDARTDLWSLGVVVYEIVTGRAPFVGETAPETISLILQKQPTPLTRYNDVPAELERIVGKALTRDREERYQTAKDLLIDLRNLKRKLEIAEIDRAVPPETSSALSTSSGQSSPATESPTETAMAQTSPPPVVSSAEYIVTRIKKHKLATAIVVGLVGLAIIGVGFGIHRLIRQNKTAISLQSAKFTRLTSTGKAMGAAISPDGKWLVHVIDDGGQQSLWLRQVAIANSNTQVVPPAEVYYGGVAFSPDGNYVYYSFREKSDFKGVLYQVPVLGGTARKLLTGIDSSVAFSPDGKKIAFFHYYEDQDRLMIGNADGTGARQLAMRQGNEYFFKGEFSGLSWSPDGKILASPIGNGAENYMSVVTVSVESGEIKSFSPKKWFQIGRVAWFADGKSILVTGNDEFSTPFQIWQIFYPAGDAQKITNDLDSYPSISLAADSGLLATVKTETVANIWVTPTADFAHATQITSGRDFDRTLSWAPNGSIVYSSNAAGSFDLYLTDSHGGTPKQLTINSRTNADPSVSHDGRYTVFTSDRTGVPHIWRMDSDGGNPKQLTDKPDINPDFSPDGQWIVYESAANKPTIWKVGTDGGEPVRISEKFLYFPAVSPDGKQIVCFHLEEPNSPVKLAIFPFDGPQALKTFALVGAPSTNLRWTGDGRAIVYGVTRSGVTNLWGQPVDGSAPRQLTAFTSDRIFWFDISRDAKQIALSRGTQTSDVVLISGFK